MAVRLPVQAGTSSLWASAVAAGTIAPGILLAAGSGTLGVVLGLVLVVVGVVELRRAWRLRATDVLLSGDGLVFEGGAWHGLVLGWSEIDGDGTRIEGEGTQRFFLKTCDEIERLIAEASHPDEQASLVALLGSVQARLGVGRGPGIDLPLEVVGCPGCGAPAKPSDSQSVTCDFCGIAVVVPESIRSRVEAQGRVDASRTAIDRTVAQLLKQPGARHANAVLLALVLLCVAAWIPISLALVMTSFDDAGRFEIGWGLVAGTSVVFVSFVFARAALAKRRALRLLASAFGARAPAREGGSPACRRCAGPLPSGKLVVACIFCAAENVLGLDLRRQVLPTEQHEVSISQVVRDRARERRRWILAAVGVVPIAAMSLIMVAVSYAVAAELDGLRSDCAADDGEACYELAIEHNLGISVMEDESKGAALLLRACALSHALACWDLAQAMHYGWGIEEDLAAAEVRREHACRLGERAACEGF